MALTKVGTDGIKNDAVTLAKQAAGTDGQIITYDASGNPKAIGPGNNGQVLTSAGAGAEPAFQDVPAGGATINNATENEIVTVASNTAQLDAEANLTFDGTALGVTGRILVGTSTEGYVNADDLTVATAADTGITIRSGTSSEGTIAFSDGTSGAAEYAGYLQYSHADNKLSIGTDGTNKVQVLSNGNLNISDGDLVIGTSGHGIDFGATGDGPANQDEIFADYEKGTWTPALSEGTCNPADAFYVRTGDLVFITCMIDQISERSSTNNLRVTTASLPFAQDGNVQAMGPCRHRYTSDHGGYQLTAIMDGNGIYFTTNDNAEGDEAFSSLNYDDIKATYSAIAFGGWYKTNA